MTVIAVKEITGRHVLIGLLGFFGIMLLVNGIFVYFALSTFNGLENPNAYRDGLHYNQRIAAAERQAALGWSHRLAVGEAGRLEVTIRDKAGEPVSGLAVNGDIRRPVGDGPAQPLVFDEVGSGIYAAKPAGLAAGNWIVSLDARGPRGGGEATAYRIKERLWLKPHP
jgi:nitrogen fixation protein FixH